MLRLLIASPYPAMRAGLHMLLDEAQRSVGGEPVRVVGEAESVDATVQWARATQAQAVLYDLAFETDDGLEGLWRLRAQTPQAAVVVLCEASNDGRVLGALQSGVRGCLPKTASGVELLGAAQSAVSGEAVLHPAATAALLQQLRGDGQAPGLTPRESEVLRQVAAGQTNKSIALKLGISEHTVKFHLGSAMTKLAASSRAEAVATAIRRGLISI